MPLDTYQRPLRDLRISVTDRCNLRCTYCMPLDEYDWRGKQDTLTFKEIVRLATMFVQLGVEKIRQGFWIEADSLGEVQAPAGAYYGAQTARAVDNLPEDALVPLVRIRAGGTQR